MYSGQMKTWSRDRDRPQPESRAGNATAPAAEAAVRANRRREIPRGAGRVRRREGADVEAGMGRGIAGSGVASVPAAPLQERDRDGAEDGNQDDQGGERVDVGIVQRQSRVNGKPQ